MARVLKYKEAIREASYQLMLEDPSVYILGLGVADHNGIWGTTLGLVDEFGRDRVLDTPLSENGMTGIAIGSCLNGMRPVFIHQRIDFMLMAMDALFNHAAKAYSMSGKKIRIPLTIRAIVGKGWGQAAQHGQSFYPVFAHFPGIQILVPFTPDQAKGALIAAVHKDDPVIIVESRELFETKGIVPSSAYETPMGKLCVEREGMDCTLISMSYLLKEVLLAAEMLSDLGVSVEVLNILSLKPIDFKGVIESVKQTRNMAVVDMSWNGFNLASELSAYVSEKLFHQLEHPPLRLGLPDDYVGASPHHEKLYYPTADQITSEIMVWLRS